MSIIEQLYATRALIDTPGKWWDGGLGNAENRTCMFLAATEATGINWGEPHTVLMRALGFSDTDPAYFGHQWNDSHTHAEVMAAFDRAIANEEAKAQEFTVTPEREPALA